MCCRPFQSLVDNLVAHKFWLIDMISLQATSDRVIRTYMLSRDGRQYFHTSALVLRLSILGLFQVFLLCISFEGFQPLCQSWMWIMIHQIHPINPNCAQIFHMQLDECLTQLCHNLAKQLSHYLFFFFFLFLLDLLYKEGVWESVTCPSHMSQDRCHTKWSHMTTVGK